MSVILAARWLDPLATPDADLRRALVRRAMADIGIEELAKNSSPYIDSVLVEAGAKPGDPWCAAALARWCKDAGVARPPKYLASCDMWIGWAKGRGLLRRADTGYTPVAGDLVFYGHGDDAHHCGVVARTAPGGNRTVEGNTSFGGFSREGIVCVYKPQSTGVLGYVTPVAA